MIADRGDSFKDPAFSQRYGYEPLPEPMQPEQISSVGLDDAIFMFGACASFAAYLTQKHRQAGGT